MSAFKRAKNREDYTITRDFDEVVCLVDPIPHAPGYSVTPKLASKNCLPPPSALNSASPVRCPRPRPRAVV